MDCQYSIEIETKSPKESQAWKFFSACYKFVPRYYNKKMLSWHYFHHLLTEYGLFLTNFDIHGPRPTWIIILFNFRKIGVDLSDYWSFYGLKLPLKYSFSLYKFYLKSSNSLTRSIFSQTLVFLYFQLTRAVIHIVEKNCKNIFLV